MLPATSHLCMMTPTVAGKWTLCDRSGEPRRQIALEAFRGRGELEGGIGV